MSNKDIMRQLHRDWKHIESHVELLARYAGIEEVNCDESKRIVDCVLEHVGYPKENTGNFAKFLLNNLNKKIMRGELKVFER